MQSIEIDYSTVELIDATPKPAPSINPKKPIHEVRRVQTQHDVGAPLVDRNPFELV